jgi:hypothetical protein
MTFVISMPTLMLIACACATIGFGGGAIVCRLVHG